MDEFLPLAGMLFSLLLALIIGGFILVYPLTRRLGRLLEIRMEERRRELADPGASEASQRELAALREAVEVLQTEVTALVDRQQFVEGLLERSERPVLGQGEQ